MDLLTLNNTIKPILDKIGIGSFSYNYWPEYNEIVSDESIDTGEDELDHKLIIRLDKSKTLGTIIYAGIAENEPCDELYLGKVKYDHENWILTEIVA